MKSYFKLQYKLLNRRLIDLGFTPVVAYILLLLAFAIVSLFLLYKIPFGDYLYTFLCLFILSKFSKTRRNDLLKTCFSIKDYRRIRIAENMFIAFPFIVFLAIKSSYTVAGILFILSMILTWVHFREIFTVTIPTPFYRKPFEFTRGFRNTFPVFFIVYYVALMAIVHDNFILGIIVLILLFINAIGFYTDPEPEYYIWSYSLNAKDFLLKKIKTALLLSSYLALPIVVGLSIFFFDKTGFILLFLLLGYAYLIMTIFFKYSIYPREMSLPETIFIIAYIVFPFIMLPLIPHLYTQSKKKLENYLK